MNHEPTSGWEGINNTTCHVRVFMLNPKTFQKAPHTTRTCTHTSPRSLHEAVGGKLYVFGGTFGGSSSKHRGGSWHGGGVLEYDPASDCWAQVTSLTSARTNMVAVQLSNR